MAEHFELRALTFIDSLQPQLVQFIAKNSRIYNPTEYDAALLIEIAPAMEIHSLVDIALKKTNVRLGGLVTERHFGLLEIHHANQGEVKEAGRAILQASGLDENDRNKIEILTNKIIRNVEQDHATSFNTTANGNMLVAGESLLIIETTPAAYLMLACNEALKAANVKLVEVLPHGATGRLVMSGSESEIDSAKDAAFRIIEKLNEMRMHKNAYQLG